MSEKKTVGWELKLIIPQTKTDTRQFCVLTMKLPFDPHREKKKIFCGEIVAIKHKKNFRRLKKEAVLSR